MVPLLVYSLLLVQPPTGPKPDDGVTGMFVLKAAEKPDDLQAALAGNPDVQIAEAEVKLAQAKLAKVKLAVAQHVTLTRTKVEQARASVTAAEQRLQVASARHKASVIGTDEVEAVTAALAVAKAVLAAAEADLKAATSVSKPAAGPKPDVSVGGQVILNERNFDLTLAARSVAPQPAGPAADKLRAALEATVPLDLPAGGTLRAACEKLAPAFAARGLVVRDPGEFSNVPAQFWKEPPAVGPLTGERPVGQWLQLIADAFTTSVGLLPNPGSRPVGGRWDFYVRDYGLLFARADDAPAGAETVGQFLGRTAATAPLPALAGKLRQALGRTVKLAGGSLKTTEVYRSILAGAGLDVAVELHGYSEDVARGSITVAPGERTVAAWLELLLDQLNVGVEPTGRAGVYVREYGLLVARPDQVPPGAVPLAAVK